MTSKAPPNHSPVKDSHNSSSLKAVEQHPEAEYYSFDYQYHQDAAAGWKRIWQASGLCLFVTLLSLGLCIMLLFAPATASVISIGIVLIILGGVLGYGILERGLHSYLGVTSTNHPLAKAKRIRTQWAKEAKAYRNDGEEDVAPIDGPTQLNGMYISNQNPEAGQQVVLSFHPIAIKDKTSDQTQSPSQDPIVSPPVSSQKRQLYEIRGKVAHHCYPLSSNLSSTISQGLLQGRTGKFYWVESQNIGLLPEQKGGPPQKWTIGRREILVQGRLDFKTRSLVEATWVDSHGNSGPHELLSWQGDLEGRTLP